MHTPADLIVPPAHLSPPGGSWSSSCAPLVHTGPVGAKSSNMLAATCGLKYGRPSWINMAMCAPGATMQNIDGVLVCSALADGVPGGSWASSCSPISYTGTVLSAYCGLFFANGTARVSRIDTSFCSAESANQIVNQFGVLTCVGTPAPSLPGKSCPGSAISTPLPSAYT